MHCVIKWFIKYIEDKIVHVHFALQIVLVI